MKLPYSDLFQQILSNKDYKRLIENFFSLSGLQIAGYILPLITLPYLVRVLGPDKYGLIAFASSFIVYFQILTDYGFNLSATREISIHRENKEKISEVFSAVMLIKIILLTISFLIFSIIIFIVPQFKSNWQIYYLTFGIIIGNVMFPTWFFQGMEKMKYITILSLVSQTIFTISIFIFIRHTSDYIYVPLINSLGFIVAGILGFAVVFKYFDVGLKLPNYKTIKFHFIEGWHVFISTVAISLYTNTNIFVLGLFTNNTIVGYFAAGEKIIRAAQGIYGPLYQSLYPYISKLTTVSSREAITVIKKSAVIMFVLTSVVSIILFFGADVIVQLLLGPEFLESVIVIKILAFLPLIIGMATIYANLFLLSFKFTRLWSKIILYSSAYSIIGAFIFLWKFDLGLIGICLNIVITEMIVLILSIIAYKKEKKLLMRE